MDYLVYLLYRGFTLLIAALPLVMVFRLGQALGWVGYLFAVPYRRLATSNLTIAYGGQKSPAEIRALARQHFLTLGANLLCSIKTEKFDAARLRQVAEVDGMENILASFARRKGIVLVISHIGNWELFAQLCQYLPDEKWGTVYQPLGNRFIEAHIQRARRKVELFNRHKGFNAPTAFLRAGGALGVLVDQHAGDGGVWTPFFGRLASTSTLASLLALRTEADLLPMAVQTNGVGRWRVVISPPVSREGPDGALLGADALTARLNAVLAAQIDRAPADWFWVHNRWKTPKPKFLLSTYRRGIVLPLEVPADSLKPFRLLIRSTNWLGDAVMTIPAVQAIARGRPDARVTILCPAKLADLWRVVPGVAEVLPIEKGTGVFGVSRTIKKAGPFDVAVLFPNSLRAALEAWLAGVPRRVGYAGHRRAKLLNQIVKEPRKAVGKEGGDVTPDIVRRLQGKEHQSRRYAHLATEIGAEDVALYGEPPARGSATTPDAKAATAPAPERGGGWLRLGICPGAEYGPTKRWLPERFAEAARLVAAERACELVLFGVENDWDIGVEIEATLGEGHRLENRIGKTTLAELMTALQGCDVLLTNDTGTMHLAAYLGVPVVAVFGSTDPILTGPLAPPERVRILRHQVECSPCFLKECPIDLRCMKIVTAEEAAAAVLDVVRGFKDSNVSK